MTFQKLYLRLNTWEHIAEPDVVERFFSMSSKCIFFTLALGRLLRPLLLSCWRWWVNTQLSQVTPCCANTVATVEWGAARSSCEKRLFVKQWTDGRRVRTVFAERPLHTGPKARRDLIHLHRPFSLMRHSESLFILEVKSVRVMAVGL